MVTEGVNIRGNLVKGIQELCVYNFSINLKSLKIKCFKNIKTYLFFSSGKFSSMCL